MAAVMLQSVLIQAAIGEGIANPKRAAIRGTNPETVAKYEIVVVISGAPINGIANTGFITIGAPKITGSLILKSPGKIDN